MINSTGRPAGGADNDVPASLGRRVRRPGSAGPAGFMDGRRSRRQGMMKRPILDGGGGAAGRLDLSRPPFRQTRCILSVARRRTPVGRRSEK